MLDNPTKYEVLIKQYLRSILDTSESLSKYCVCKKRSTMFDNIWTHDAKHPNSRCLEVWSKAVLSV